MKTFYGHQKRKLIDIQPWLLMTCTKRKSLQKELKNHDWSQYANYVGIYCSVEPSYLIGLLCWYLPTFTIPNLYFLEIN